MPEDGRGAVLHGGLGDAVPVPQVVVLSGFQVCRPPSGAIPDESLDADSMAFDRTGEGPLAVSLLCPTEPCAIASVGMADSVGIATSSRTASIEGKLAGGRIHTGILPGEIW